MMSKPGGVLENWQLESWASRYWVIDKDGEAREDPESLGLTSEQLLRFYRDMFLARRFDQEAMALQRQGEFAVYAPLAGQEACQVGSASAMDSGDWVFPSYREPAALMVRGLDAASMLHINRGTWIGGLWDPYRYRIAPYCVPLASQLPHAVGFALGSRLNQSKDAVVVYFGDGSTSEGDFHEALNLSSVFDTPVVFFCQNNGWAISVPTARQMRAPVHKRAIGYGIEGVCVDGNDVLACYAVTKAALARARTEHRPTLIEALTFRMGPHSTSDDLTRYQHAEHRSAWEARDPIDRYRRFLEKRGLWSEQLDGETAAAADELGAAIRRSIVGASNLPATDLFEHVYAEPPQGLQDQMRQVREQEERQLS